MDVYPILKISREVNSLQHPLVTFSRVLSSVQQGSSEAETNKNINSMNLVTSTEKGVCAWALCLHGRDVFTKQAIQTETICLEQMWEVGFKRNCHNKFHSMNHVNKFLLVITFFKV